MLCFGLQDSIGRSETSFLCTLGLHAAPGEPRARRQKGCCWVQYPPDWHPDTELGVSSRQR